MKFRIAVLAGFAAVLLAACADNRAPEEIVAERAQARLDAIAAGDYEAAWGFLTPGLRAETTRRAYVADMMQRPVRWIEGRVDQVHCQEARCEVETRVTYEVARGPAQLVGMRNTRSLSEIWIQSGGNWWYSEAD